MIGNLPTLDAAVQRVESATTEREVHRAGYILLAVVLLLRPDYNVTVPDFPEEE